MREPSKSYWIRTLVKIVNAGSRADRAGRDVKLSAGSDAGAVKAFCIRHIGHSRNGGRRTARSGRDVKMTAGSDAGDVKVVLDTHPSPHAATGTADVSGASLC